MSIYTDCSAVVNSLPSSPCLLGGEGSHSLRLSCLMSNCASPSVRCNYPSYASAVYSHSCISTVRSYTQYNLSSILQFFLYTRCFSTGTLYHTFTTAPPAVCSASLNKALESVQSMHRAATRLANSQSGSLTGLTGLTGLTDLTANLHPGQSHTGVVFLSVVSDQKWAN
jgi:hypothetical protein